MGSTHRNFLSLTVGEVGSRVLGFAATALLARRVGADGFGVLGFAFALNSYLIVPGLGLQSVAAREVAKRPSDVARVASGVIRVRLLFSIGQIALASALVLLLPKPPAVQTVVALGTVMLVPLAMNAGWAYKALERSSRVAQSLFVAQLIYLLGVVLFVFDPGDVRLVPIIQAVGELGAALMLLPIVRGGWEHSTIREGFITLRGGTLATVSRYLRTLTVTGDVLILSFLTTDSDVGLYTASYRICFLLTAIAACAHVVFIAPMTRTRDDNKAGGIVLSRALWLSWMAVLPLVVGGALVAGDTLELLFGAHYRAGAESLQLLLASIGLFALHGTVRNLFLVRGRMDADAAINGVTAVINVGLNLWLIPRYGLNGAAFAMVLTEVLVLGASGFMVIRWGLRPKLSLMLPSTAAVLVMSVVVLLLPSAWHVLLRIALGGAIYTCMLWLLGDLKRASRDLREAR